MGSTGNVPPMRRPIRRRPTNGRRRRRRRSPGRCPKSGRRDRRGNPTTLRDGPASLRDSDHASSGGPRERYRDCSNADPGSAGSHCALAGDSANADPTPGCVNRRAAAIADSDSASVPTSSDVVQDGSGVLHLLRADLRRRGGFQFPPDHLPAIATDGWRERYRLRSHPPRLPPPRGNSPHHRHSDAAPAGCLHRADRRCRCPRRVGWRRLAVARDDSPLRGRHRDDRQFHRRDGWRHHRQGDCLREVGKRLRRRWTGDLRHRPQTGDCQLHHPA
jgi:hypothetical protein